MSETVLIVDDEDGVRRTFQEWLAGVPDVRVFTAPDAERALVVANEHPVDLAVLDWNLGSGSDGLRLLQDLVDFRPEMVAILVTGFANQATPLDALRMGVRDYLDKNHDLDRETFLHAVTKQLDRIRPAKRQRELNASLAAFRETVEKVLPLVRGAAALNDPVPLPDA
ncbi:MAG TPA: response regulator, partial [Fimbriiglobus sp.]|nr:response regulator [Fimbriiglobus sp.]